MPAVMDPQRRAELQRRRIALRLALFGLVSSVWIAAILGRLVHLQIVKRDFLRDLAELQQLDTRSLDPTRGAILDRNGRELAVSVEVESVGAAPSAIADRAGAARSLARCLATPREEIAKRLASGRRFVWIERKADPSAVDCVRRLELAGVTFVPESRRFYPKRSVAAHVLGYVGTDNEGLNGIEYALETEIKGEPGRQIVLTDARRRRASSRVDRLPLPGRSVYLTLDETLQHVAETEIEEAVRETESKSGMAIVMRPDTGEILALAAAPTFNPNAYGASPSSSWRNRAVTDPYEPGSTFKIITAAAALEEQVVTEEERIDCGRGAIRVDDRTILDHRSFDILPFRDVVEKSSNVGMIRIGQRLGRDRFLAYIKRFGFGQLTGVELSGESRGIVHERWSGSTLASVSFGQEIAVTPVQMVAAVNAIATSGYLMKPRLVREVRSPGGQLVRGFAPEPVARVVSAATADRLTEILIGVVAHGTGTRAQIPGYTVAGKTGTAQKAGATPGYSETDYVASFVGFVPAERPELTAMVVLDSPVGDHSGGTVAASVFSRIVERSLHYLGVAPSAPDRAVVVAESWPSQATLSLETLDELVTPAPPTAADVARVAFGRSEANRLKEPPQALMPSFFGLPARDAVARAVASGLVPRISGTGRVLSQTPEAGVPIEHGAPCHFVLSDAPLPAETGPPPLSELRRGHAVASAKARPPTGR